MTVAIVLPPNKISVPEYKGVVKYECHCKSDYYIFPRDCIFKIFLVHEGGFRLSTYKKAYKGDENIENISHEEIKIVQLMQPSKSKLTGHIMIVISKYASVK